jgi:RNA recognition motif-containing protein
VHGSQPIGIESQRRGRHLTRGLQVDRLASDHAGRTRGFALVELEDRAAAIALQSLKGAELKGRMMSVAVNRPLPVVRRQAARSGRTQRKPTLPAHSHKSKA